MKKNFILFMLIVVMGVFTGAAVQAQFLDLKGITIHAHNSSYTSGGEEVTDQVDQVYNFSFADKILAHTVFKDGYIENSQIYQVSGIEKFMTGDITNYKSTANSGVSGSNYFYHIKIDKEGKLISLLLTQESGSFTKYTGDIYDLRTYKQ